MSSKSATKWQYCFKILVHLSHIIQNISLQKYNEQILHLTCERDFVKDLALYAAIDVYSTTPTTITKITTITTTIS